MQKFVGVKCKRNEKNTLTGRTKTYSEAFASDKISVFCFISFLYEKFANTIMHTNIQ